MKVREIMTLAPKACCGDHSLSDAVQLEGIVSLNDISRAADRERERAAKKRAVRADDVVQTLAAICRPRFAESARKGARPKRGRRRAA